MSLIVLIIILFILLISYPFYISPKIRQNLFPTWKRSTPARRRMDGKSFFPTPSSILAGFQFRSISLDVVISPVIAVQFGWLPAIVWLLVGAIFFGWVQDFLAAIISVRSNGESFPELFRHYFNRHSEPLIYLFLLAYLVIIISQFSVLVSSLLIREEVPFAVLVFILVGWIAGFLIYRMRMNIFLVSLLSILIGSIGILVRSTTHIADITGQIIQSLEELGNVSSPGSLLGGLSWQLLVPLLVIFLFSYASAIAPGWRFAVPFNYITALLVIIGFSVALIGLVVGLFNGSIATEFEIPAFITALHPQIGPLWPILFVTLSSGAVSGWHSLVSSFSTSHQVEKEPQINAVTTRAMYGETVIVALIIILAATFGVSTGLFDTGQNYAITSGPASVFASGFALTWKNIGFSQGLGASFSTILLTLMALSILHLVVRYARIVYSKIFVARVPVLMNPHISTLVVLLTSLILVIVGLREWLWILFAGANQLLASLVLMFASIWLVEQNKAIYWTFLPSIFLFITGLAALFYSAIYQLYLSNIVTNENISGQTIIMSIFAILFAGSASYIYLVGLRKVLNRNAVKTEPSKY